MNARQARESGIKVPEDVPDCAEFICTGSEMGGVEQDKRDPTIVNGVFNLQGYWKWVNIDITYTIKPESRWQKIRRLVSQWISAKRSTE